MPTYQYACDECGEKFEIVQSFTDSTLTTHTTGCGGPVHKRFGGIAVAFKGTGFYRNDSRQGPQGESSSTGSDTKSETTSDTKSETKTDTKSQGAGEKKSETKTESKPAAASTPSSTTSSSSTPAA